MNNVDIFSEKTAPKTLSWGISQGSVLSSVLLPYANSPLVISMYVNDSQFYLASDNNPDVLNFTSDNLRHASPTLYNGYIKIYPNLAKSESFFASQPPTLMFTISYPPAWTVFMLVHLILTSRKSNQSRMQLPNHFLTYFSISWPVVIIAALLWLWLIWCWCTPGVH